MPAEDAVRSSDADGQVYCPGGRRHAQPSVAPVPPLGHGGRQALSTLSLRASSLKLPAIYFQARPTEQIKWSNYVTSLLLRNKIHRIIIIPTREIHTHTTITTATQRTQSNQVQCHGYSRTQLNQRSGRRRPPLPVGLTRQRLLAGWCSAPLLRWNTKTQKNIYFWAQVTGIDKITGQVPNFLLKQGINKARNYFQVRQQVGNNLETEIHILISISTCINKRQHNSSLHGHIVFLE